MSSKRAKLLKRARAVVHVRGGPQFRSLLGHCFSPSASRREQAYPILARSSCRLSQTHPPAGDRLGVQGAAGPGALVGGRAVGVRAAEARGRPVGTRHISGALRAVSPERGALPAGSESRRPGDAGRRAFGGVRGVGEAEPAPC